MLKIEWFIYFHHKINLRKNGIAFQFKGLKEGDKGR